MKNLIDLQPIYDYISNNNLTKKEFCKQCGISLSTFYRITNGENFNLINLFKIAKHIELPIHKFFE